MRILAVDVGNSRTKYALCENGNILSRWWHSTVDALAAAATVLDQCDAPVVISSVVPAATTVLEQLCRARQRELTIVTSSNQSVVKQTSGELGSDLLAMVVAARKLYAPDKNLIVIGLGTATTMVRIASDGQFGGVHIILGLTGMLEEIARRCALVPDFSSADLKDIKPGFNTKDAVCGGNLHALIAIVDSWITHARAEGGADTVAVLTGGWSSKVAQFTKLPNLVDDELVLKGIYCLYEESQQQATPH